MIKSYILLLIPSLILCLGLRRLEEECSPIKTSYAIYVIDAKISELPGNSNCNYTLTFVTGDCAYSSPLLSNEEAGDVCFNDTSLVCDGINSNSFAGYATIYCGNEVMMELFEPVANYSLMKEFQIKSSNISANVLVGKACDVSDTSDPHDWVIPGLPTCKPSMEEEPIELAQVTAYYPWWGHGGRYYGRRYYRICRRRGWRRCWRWYSQWNY